MTKSLKKIIIHTGSLTVGGQEKMLSELLKILNYEKYEILLLIEEDYGDKNIYEKNIPNCVTYKFLTPKKFMQKLEKYKKNKSLYSKILYSLMLKMKKKIAIKNMKKYLNFSDIVIDYNFGLLRHCNKLDLEKKKLIGWCHAGLGEKLKNRKKEKNRRRYTEIVTINEEMKKSYEENLGKYGIKVHKIPNFLDEKIIVEKSKEKIQENLGEYIISVGALTKNKNNISLIYAFKELVDLGIKENLVILGEGKEREKLEKAIKSLKLEKRVMLLGVRENPYKYIKKSSLFVQCSFSEGFPLVLLEAMILGKAVVSTENYGSKEVLKNGKYGIIVKNEIEKIKEGIYSLLTNNDLKINNEKLSLERSEEFSLEAGRKKMEEFIDKL